MSGQLHDPSAVPLGSTPVPVEQEAWWSREPVWTFWKTQNSLATAESPLDVLPTTWSLHWLNYSGLLFHSTIQKKLYIPNTDESTKLAGFVSRELCRFIFFIIVVFFYSGLLPTMGSLNVTTMLGVWRQFTVRLEICYGFWTDNEAWLQSLVGVSDLDDLCSDLRVIRPARRLERNWQLQQAWVV